jgi:hypothetical protein
VNAAEQPPESKQQPRRNRRVIHATCSRHGGGTGFTNLVATKRDGSIELDPHADGSCLLTLDEEAATQRRRLLRGVDHQRR